MMRSYGRVSLMKKNTPKNKYATLPRYKRIKGVMYPVTLWLPTKRYNKFKSFADFKQVSLEDLIIETFLGDVRISNCLEIFKQYLKGNKPLETMDKYDDDILGILWSVLKSGMTPIDLLSILFDNYDAQPDIIFNICSLIDRSLVDYKDGRLVYRYYGNPRDKTQTFRTFKGEKIKATEGTKPGSKSSALKPKVNKLKKGVSHGS